MSFQLIIQALVFLRQKKSSDHFSWMQSLQRTKERHMMAMALLFGVGVPLCHAIEFAFEMGRC